MLSRLGVKVWNGCLDLALRMELEGDAVADREALAVRHLGYLAGFDSLVMSDGLDEAMSQYPCERMTLVSDAFDYFGLGALASLVRQLAASDSDYRLAQDLNVAYWEGRGRNPGESLIDVALEEKLRSSPEDFGLNAQESR